MKKVLLSIILCYFFTGLVAQEPQLQLTGGGVSVNKGTIDTEVLTAIIQEKQEEIKQRIFRNTIVRHFNTSNYTRKLNNFATFNYLYNTMEVLTNGKNKKVMTKSLIKSSSDFAFVYGLTLYLDKTLIDSSKVNYPKNTRGINSDVEFINTEVNKDSIKKFNINIDLTHHILLNMEDELKNYFNFENSINDKYFNQWYKNDNKYLKHIRNLEIKKNNASPEQKTEIEEELKKLKKKETGRTNEIKSFLTIINNLETAYDKLTEDEINKSSYNKDTLTNRYKLKTSYLIDNLEELAFEKIDPIKLELAFNSLEYELEHNLQKDSLNKETNLKKSIETSLIKFKDFYAENKETIQELLNFYKGLKKSKFKDFSLTKDQYNALKFIIKEFISLAQNQYDDKDVIASVLNFLLENTIVEFTNIEGTLITENETKLAGSDSKGYLYIDVASLISAIDANFGSIKRKKWLNYFTPFMSVGTNYASFNSNNNLLIDNQDMNQDLNDLYFASEKIGLKVKLWNWKYTHSFKSGEPIDYWFIKDNSWKRPQPDPFVNDIYLMAYGSGLLYNLVDLKSEEQFNYAIVGAGVGITFFNGLSLNVGYASPLVEGNLDNGFLNIGLDIPILEYISAIKNK